MYDENQLYIIVYWKIWFVNVVIMGGYEDDYKKMNILK